MQTNVDKAKTGWRAETSIDLNDKQVLKLNTRSNTRGGIATWASVHEVQDNGMLAHVLMQDFSTAVRIDTTVRCTEKAVRRQHDVVLSFLEQIKQSVQAFYGPKEPTSGASWQSYLVPVQIGAVGA